MTETKGFQIRIVIHLWCSLAVPRLLCICICCTFERGTITCFRTWLSTSCRAFVSALTSRGDPVISKALQVLPGKAPRKIMSSFRQGSPANSCSTAKMSSVVFFVLFKARWIIWPFPNTSSTIAPTEMADASGGSPLPLPPLPPLPPDPSPPTGSPLGSWGRGKMSIYVVLGLVSHYGLAIGLDPDQVPQISVLRPPT